MDWITFIKWNGIVYASYYGVNFLVDFWRTRGEFTQPSGPVQYKLKDFGIEQPQLVKSADYLPENGVTGNNKGEKAKLHENPRKDGISFGSPIERQAIPLNEFIRIAGKSGSEIFQPTI